MGHGVDNEVRPHTLIFFEVPGPWMRACSEHPDSFFASPLLTMGRGRRPCDDEHGRGGGGETTWPCLPRKLRGKVGCMEERSLERGECEKNVEDAVIDTNLGSMVVRRRTGGPQRFEADRL
jgi:hypothetical protein